MPNATEKAYIISVESSSKEKPQLPEPDWDNRFFKQRTTQRNVLFYFSLGMSLLSLAFLVFLIFIQAYLRVKIDQNFEIISDTGMQIIAVAIFGQIFGVVYIIAKALWSNHEFTLMKK